MFSLYLLLSVLAALNIAAYSQEDKANIIQFDEIAKKWVEKKSKELGKAARWWDLHGEMPQIWGEPDNADKKITMTTEEFTYDSPSEVDNNKNVYKTEEITNESDEPLTKKLSESATFHSYAVWKVENGLSFGDAETKPKVPANLPPEMEKDRIEDESVDISSLEDVHVFDAMEKQAEKEVTVDPKSKVKVSWMIDHHHVNTGWATHVKLTGEFAVAWDGDADITFYSVTELASEDLTVEDKGLVFNAKGKFRGLIPTDFEAEIEKIES